MLNSISLCRVCGEAVVDRYRNCVKLFCLCKPKTQSHTMITFNHGEIPDFPFQQAVKKPIPIRCYQIHEPFKIQTMEGLMEGKAGDYLIVGVRGEMYACDKSIFEETYDIISTSGSPGQTEQKL